MVTFLAGALGWWSDAYANHAVLRTAVAFGHIGGLLGGGGCAVAADQAVLRLSRDDAAGHLAQAGAIRRAHRVVVAGLVALVLSGLLLLAADFDTYVASRLFWLKMALFATLLVNGTVLLRAGEPARGNAPVDWRRMRWASVVSVALWALVTLLGTALPNIG
jgi:hypothetical protein